MYQRYRNKKESDKKKNRQNKLTVTHSSEREASVSFQVVLVEVGHVLESDKA